MSTREPLRRACLAALLALLVRTDPAGAHGGAGGDVAAVLDPLPAALRGISVELHTTIATQVVVANPTGRTLEVLDDEGVSFLRLGPAGTEGNLAARAWYATYAPGATAPEELLGSQPLWAKAAGEPSFGWFEPRLDAARVEVPRAVRAAGRAAYFGRWQLPLRLDGVPVALRGRFRWQPPPPGVYVARLTSAGEVAPGVRVTLLPGRAPGLLLDNRSRHTVLVSGVDGEPFLRIGPAGVEANGRSRSWAESGRAGGLRPVALEQSAAPEWRLVAPQPRFSWIEARALYPHRLPPAAFTAAGAADVLEWRVPLQVGDEAAEVRGVVTWMPAR